MVDKLNDLRIPNPPSRSKPLGPNQLAWCREHIEHFATCEKQVKASKGETE